MKPITIAHVFAIFVLIALLGCRPTDDNDDPADGEPPDDDSAGPPDDDNNDQTIDDDNDNIEPIVHDGAFALWAFRRRGNYFPGHIMRYDGNQFWHEFPPGNPYHSSVSLADLSGFPNQSIIAVGFYDGYLCDYPAVVYWDGHSWTETSPDLPVCTYLGSVSCSDVDRCYFVGHTETPWGNSHYVFGTTNGRAIEVKQVGSEDSWLFSVWASATDVVWAAGSRVEEDNKTVRPLMARWEDGQFEEIVLDEIGCESWGVAGRQDNDVFASGKCGNDGALYHYDETTWVKITTGMEEGRVFHGISFGGPDLVYVVAGNQFYEDFVLLVGDATEWQAIEIPGGAEVRGVWARRANDVYLGYEEGLLHFDGENWQEIPGPDLGSLWGYEIPPTAADRHAGGDD